MIELDIILKVRGRMEQSILQVKEIQSIDVDEVSQLKYPPAKRVNRIRRTSDNVRRVNDTLDSNNRLTQSIPGHLKYPVRSI